MLNTVACSVIEEIRGHHPCCVFMYRGGRVCHMNNTARKRTRRAAGLPHLRVQSLKHKFGRRRHASVVPPVGSIGSNLMNAPQSSLLVKKLMRPRDGST